MDALRRSQPDAPMMTTELQGGWFVGVGDEPPLRPDADHYIANLVPSQITNLTLFVYQNGETITNYYMLFGGTNLGDGAAQNIATCYDYNAPIRENGGVGEKYLRVKALGEMIREHGTELARADAVECETTTDHRDVTVVERRAANGSRFLFVRTDQHGEPRSGAARVKEKGGTKLTFHYDLEPFGSKVLYLPPGTSDVSKGEWLPKAQAPIARPTQLPGPVRISESLTKADPGPQQWKPVKAGQRLPNLGVYDSRYVFYSSRVSMIRHGSKSTSARPTTPGNSPRTRRPSSEPRRS